MIFADHPVVLRGGGDIATGVAWRLVHAGFPVIVCELAAPLTVRRTVALSSAVIDGSIEVEGLQGVRVDDPERLVDVARTGVVPVIVSPCLPAVETAGAVVDARLAKINIDTTIGDAPTVVGLGPGFVAGEDCHVVVETMRGHHLGRVIWHGGAAANTGTPGIIGGRGAERVLRSPADGQAVWAHAIGDVVCEGDLLGHVADLPVVAPFDGVVRGLVSSAAEVRSGYKIGDIDPRADPTACFEISDKALSVGGGVVEAILSRIVATAAQPDRLN